MISQASVELVKDAIKIEEVIGEFISLKRRGINYLANCPFHDERTSSFSVSSSHNSYTCFGCGAKGDAIDFVMKHEHFEFIEAIEFLAAKYKIVLEGSSEPGVKNEKEQLLAVTQFAQEYFRGNMLMPKDPAAAYSATRAINEIYQPGSAIESGKTLLKAASLAGFPPDLLYKGGLVAQDQDGRYYDYFRTRLMLPFHDLSGRIIGFTSRALREDKRIPKYLNSPETPLFKKGNVLFGIYQAKAEIVREDECIVVEGNIDVSSFHNKNILNTVCSSGTALTSEQIKLIRRFTNCITFIYDPDTAGKKAAIKAIDIAIKEGMLVYLVKLPDGEDPDDFAKLRDERTIREFIESNRMDFISYRKLVADPEDLTDTQLKSELLKSLMTTCNLVEDPITKAAYIRDISVIFETPEKDLLQALKLKPELKKDELVIKPFFALEFSKDAIVTLDAVVFHEDNQQVVESHVDEKGNTIGIGITTPTLAQFAELASLTKNAFISTPFSYNFVTFEDNHLIRFANELIDNSFNVMVKSFDLPDKDLWISFLDYYIDSYVTILNTDNNSADNTINKVAVERAAQLLAKYDPTTITLKTPAIAGKFGLSAGNFNKIIKPYLDKKKNRKQLRSEDIVIDDTKYVFDIENLPEYVDKKFFYKFGFFPAQNKEGKRIFYVFRTSENVLAKVGNFFMEPLFQVWNLDITRNKRVVRLNHADLGNSEYVEMPSAGMMDFATFKKFLWNQGGYVFSKGKPFHHEVILESIALQFPKAFEFDNFGWQKEGFFAFANGIYADEAFKPVNELGLVNHKSATYYSPAFSVIFTDQRDDSDKYKNDRFLIFKPNEETSFQQWSKLMTDVYKYNDNGMWSVLFMLLATNRSIIFPLERYFTAPFFIGPTESGKSKIAESIRAPFMYGAPLFNLNSGTDAAFFTVLERYRDCPVPFEEYNDNQISDVKFQGLKAAVYDSEGKTKRKDASSKELDQSQVNCAPILLGQESPEQDDGSLSNRCILLHVPKKDDWSDEEIVQYNDLKDRERKGLTNILTGILKKRPLVQKHFGAIQRQVHKKLKEDLNSSGSFYQTRILNTVSLFVSMITFWKEHAPEMPLSFSFDEFYEVAKTKIISQSDSIHKSNRLSVFFDTLMLLQNKVHGIIEGKEFKYEDLKEVLIQTNRNTSEIVRFPKPVTVIFLRMNLLHTMYRDVHKAEALKYNSMMNYLKGHPAYIGNVNSTRFTWQEVVEIANPSGYVEKRLQDQVQKTSALAMNYDMLGIDLRKTDESSEELPTPAPIEPEPNVDPTLPF